MFRQISMLLFKQRNLNNAITSFRNAFREFSEEIYVPHGDKASIYFYIIQKGFKNFPNLLFQAFV